MIGDFVDYFVECLLEEVCYIDLDFVFVCNVGEIDCSVLECLCIVLFFVIVYNDVILLDWFG